MIGEWKTGIRLLPVPDSRLFRVRSAILFWAPSGIPAVQTIGSTNVPAIGQIAHIPTKAALMKATIRSRKSPKSSGSCSKPNTRGGYAVIRAIMAGQQKSGMPFIIRPFALI